MSITDKSLERSIQPLEQSINILEATSKALKQTNARTRYLSNVMLRRNRNYY